MPHALLFALGLSFLISAAQAQQAQTAPLAEQMAPVEGIELNEWHKRFLKNYEDNIAFDTLGGKNTLGFAQMVAKRLITAGIPEKDVEVIDTGDGKGIVVARLRSPKRTASGESELPPIAFLAHSDRVPADVKEWKIKNDKGELITLEPLKLTRINGPTFEIAEEVDAQGNKKEVLTPLGAGTNAKFFARGANDDMHMLSAIETAFERMAQEGYKGKRDLILIFAGDEENGDPYKQGIKHIFLKRPELIKDVELMINEGGVDVLKDGRVLSIGMQVAEKVTATYLLEKKGVSRHSSEPGPAETNPLYAMAQGIANVSKMQFPVRLTDITRNYFEKIKDNETPEMKAAIEALLAGETNPASPALAPLMADPAYAAQVSNTCSATMASGSQAANIVPGVASGAVNCRVLPGDSVDEVARKLAETINTPASLAISVKPRTTPDISDPSPVDEKFAQIAAQVVEKHFGKGVPFTPAMSNGGTVMRGFRNAGYLAYGLNLLPLGEKLSNMHANNEWVGVKEALIGHDAIYDLMAQLSTVPLSGTKQPPRNNN